MANHPNRTKIRTIGGRNFRYFPRLRGWFMLRPDGSRLQWSGANWETVRRIMRAGAFAATRRNTTPQ